MPAQAAVDIDTRHDTRATVAEADEGEEDDWVRSASGAYVKVERDRKTKKQKSAKAQREATYELLDDLPGPPETFVKGGGAVKRGPPQLWNGDEGRPTVTDDQEDVDILTILDEEFFGASSPPSQMLDGLEADTRVGEGRRKPTAKRRAWPFVDGVAEEDGRRDANALKAAEATSENKSANHRVWPVVEVAEKEGHNAGAAGMESRATTEKLGTPRAWPFVDENKGDNVWEPRAESVDTPKVQFKSAVGNEDRWAGIMTTLKSSDEKSARQRKCKNSCYVVKFTRYLAAPKSTESVASPYADILSEAKEPMTITKNGKEYKASLRHNPRASNRPTGITLLPKELEFEKPAAVSLAMMPPKPVAPKKPLITSSHNTSSKHHSLDATKRWYYDLDRYYRESLPSASPRLMPLEKGLVSHTRAVIAALEASKPVTDEELLACLRLDADSGHDPMRTLTDLEAWLLFDQARSVRGRRGLLRGLTRDDWRNLAVHLIFAAQPTTKPDGAAALTPQQPAEQRDAWKFPPLAQRALDILQAMKDVAARPDDVTMACLARAHRGPLDARKLGTLHRFVRESCANRGSSRSQPLLISDFYARSLLGVLASQPRGQDVGLGSVPQLSARALRDQIWTDMQVHHVRPSRPTILAFLELGGADADKNTVQECHKILLARKDVDAWGVEVYEGLMVAHERCGNAPAVVRLWEEMRAKDMPTPLSTCLPYARALSRTSNHTGLRDLSLDMIARNTPLSDAMVDLLAPALVALKDPALLSHHIRSRLPTVPTVASRPRLGTPITQRSWLALVKANAQLNATKPAVAAYAELRTLRATSPPGHAGSGPTDALPHLPPRATVAQVLRLLARDAKGEPRRVRVLMLRDAITRERLLHHWSSRLGGSRADADEEVVEAERRLGRDATRRNRERRRVAGSGGKRNARSRRAVVLRSRAVKARAAELEEARARRRDVEWMRMKVGKEGPLAVCYEAVEEGWSEAIDAWKGGETSKAEAVMALGPFLEEMKAAEMAIVGGILQDVRKVVRGRGSGRMKMRSATPARRPAATKKHGGPLVSIEEAKS
ncbi:hypothetical protein HK101_010574 [Irineochytrium annulatum]|nr:hypothetical protein HK101_010574 [Irineochytrium annulatum]